MTPYRTITSLDEIDVVKQPNYTSEEFDRLKNYPLNWQGKFIYLDIANVYRVYSRSMKPIYGQEGNAERIFGTHYGGTFEFRTSLDLPEGYYIENIRSGEYTRVDNIPNFLSKIRAKFHSDLAKVRANWGDYLAPLPYLIGYGDGNTTLKDHQLKRLESPHLREYDTETNCMAAQVSDKWERSVVRDTVITYFKVHGPDLLNDLDSVIERSGNFAVCLQGLIPYKVTPLTLKARIYTAIKLAMKAFPRDWYDDELHIFTPEEGLAVNLWANLTTSSLAYIGGRDKWLAPFNKTYRHLEASPA